MNSLAEKQIPSEPEVAGMRRLGGLARACAEIAGMSCASFATQLAHKAAAIDAKRLQGMTEADVDAIFCGRRLLSRQEWKVLLDLAGGAAMKVLEVHAKPLAPNPQSWIESIESRKTRKAAEARRAEILGAAIRLAELAGRCLEDLARNAARLSPQGMETPELAQKLITDTVEKKIFPTEKQWNVIAQNVLGLSLVSLRSELSAFEAVVLNFEPLELIAYRSRILRGLIAITNINTSTLVNCLRYRARTLGVNFEQNELEQKVEDVIAGRKSISDAEWICLAGGLLRNVEGLIREEMAGRLDAERRAMLLRGCMIIRNVELSELKPSIDQWANRRSWDSEIAMQTIRHALEGKIELDAEERFLVDSTVISPVTRFVQSELSYCTVR